ncbi:hypothetical protein LTR84_003490 [Exophiala bonariae]|uniref:Acyl-protein thioesterase 1 n=1 Tax=Exophiala bonariae TaxID=1690606 RepID=A0AAV9N743_9EURO|nr:hypothetical protein LTR84_003490 [Exophiala bonariae]
MSAKPPYVVQPTVPATSPDRSATLIFLHGYGDDAEGIPLGLAQQFQFYNKAQYLKWVLPNAPRNQEAMTQAWYIPKALPNAMKPRVPGEADEADAADDEEGILKSVAVLDDLVEQEIKSGTPPERILVGGFSQGCAISLVWGLTGRLRNKVGGVMCLSGYLPLRDRIEALRKENPVEDAVTAKKWFYVHGTTDMLIPTKLFVQGNEELMKWVDRDDIDGHLYPGLGHSTGAAELRDMLAFFNRVIPE